MTWKRLLESRQVQVHKTSAEEIDDIRQLVARDLADASVLGLSADRKFATAYNAVLQLSKMAIACAGYRVTSGVGHHQNTFEAAKVALGAAGEAFADYFETCRRKRNQIDYTRSEVASETEAEEMLDKARNYHVLVENWILTHYPKFRV